MTEPAAISFRSASKTYSAATDGTPDHVALDRLSLDIATREFLAVVGPSGSGKTTLLRLINRLNEPDTGAVLVGGEDIRSHDPVLLRRRIGYVFQGIGLFPHLSVAENIAITPKLLGWSEAKRAARVDELLDLVRLSRTEHRDRLPAQLSGGQRQRVGLARAIAASPKIMLMDEPFGALDPLTRTALSDDYRRLHDDLGLTTVMITHDILEAVLLADRIAVIRSGRIEALGTPRELLAIDDNEYVSDLMAAPRRQADRLAAALEGRPS